MQVPGVMPGVHQKPNLIVVILAARAKRNEPQPATTVDITYYFVATQAGFLHGAVHAKDLLACA
jgi:hypothetical protein